MTAAPSPALNIRPARTEDRPALIAFMGELQAHEVMMEPTLADPREMAAPHVEALETWAKESNGGFIVAEQGGMLIGFMVYGIEEDFGYYVQPQFKKIGRISDLYVEPGHREKGIGRAMIAVAEEKLRKAGVKRLEITTLFENLEARGFYEMSNYRPYQVHYAKTL